MIKLGEPSTNNTQEYFFQDKNKICTLEFMTKLQFVNECESWG